MSTDKTTFLERLLAYRKKHGLTQRDVAGLFGVSRQYICMIERGREPGNKIVNQLTRLEDEDSEPRKLRRVLGIDQMPEEALRITIEESIKRDNWDTVVICADEMARRFREKQSTVSASPETVTDQKSKEEGK